MGKLVPILLVLVIAGGATAAGLVFRPAPVGAEDTPPPPTAHDYVKMNNQFVVPVVEGGRVAAMVILSLSLETTVGASAEVYAKEPKLRDGFLQVLFDHANTGGFRGSFTDASNLVTLRRSLAETGQRVLGPILTDVLIVDIMRQDS